MTIRRLTILACALAALLPSAASANRKQESMFQDDPALVGESSVRTAASTLDKLQEIGVDRVRVSVFWAIVAPAGEQPQRPNFDATNPAAYPAANWERYDRVIRLATARGIAVNLNPTSPVPRWAAQGSPRADLQKNYGPDPIQFGQFVQALGTRYSGSYMSLPRVDFWSIWNEPNQAGWLTPQWRTDPRDPKRQVEAAPSLYRNLLSTAYAGLQNSGHGQDTIILGDTAPAGQQSRKGISQSIDPLRFIRQVYCLDDNAQILRGSSAEARGCPATPNATAFAAMYPALFRASGWGHHPYAFFTPPRRKSSAEDWVTIANLGDLQRELKRIYARYGQKTQDPRGVPTWLTEFGYQTPPDPLGIPFSQQAAYLNEAEYIAFNNKLVRSSSQFLLNDDRPLPGVKDRNAAYITFQSGLRTAAGKDKPAMKAYVTPIFVTKTKLARGATTKVWGGLRAATGTAPKAAQIQFRRKGSARWRTIATRRAEAPRFFVETNVKVPGTGALRLLWRNGSRPTASRAVTVTAR